MSHPFEISEPKFIQHIGLMIVITTTVCKLVGTLDDVFIDHVALVVNEKNITFDYVKSFILK
nr:DUF2642 domain-containing protein [Paenibacillus azoreducens]